jgi:hypothetical protein
MLDKIGENNKFEDIEYNAVANGAFRCHIYAPNKNGFLDMVNSIKYFKYMMCKTTS